MSDELSFADLMARVRAGDQDAATALVQRYEPQIRRVVRIRLVSGRLKGMLDSMDVCQSVMGSFFYRAALGQYEIEKPEDLIGLLARMARNKLADQARKAEADRRGGGMVRVGEAGEIDVAGREATPSRIFDAREMLGRARSYFSAEELYLVEQRASGRQWADLAAELGSTPEALRKKHSRAVERVARELGLDAEESE